MRITSQNIRVEKPSATFFPWDNCPVKVGFLSPRSLSLGNSSYSEVWRYLTDENPAFHSTYCDHIFWTENQHRIRQDDKILEIGTTLEIIHIWLPYLDVFRKPALDLCLMSSGYHMISYSLNLPKGSLAFFDLRVNHHHTEFAISEICTSVVPLFSFSFFLFFGVCIFVLCFQLYLKLLEGRSC